ncbi:hypothetical protein Tco_0877249 [Tanacetum coccineum]|uniref:Uncharacterized protein n=1 Tax=Tanacetum coccineum TaxID=301880 RepID=A0ABQ5BY11_9ASTR
MKQFLAQGSESSSVYVCRRVDSGEAKGKRRDGKIDCDSILQTNTAVQHYRDQDDPHDDAYPEGENSAKRQKTSEYEAYVSGDSSSGQAFQEEQAPSTSGNQEQDDEI